jgi:hypothetical protein
MRLVANNEEWKKKANSSVIINHIFMKETYVRKYSSGSESRVSF